MFSDLQHAIVEVFTLLASQSISPEELSTYLTFFKVENPPLLVLLQPLYRLVLLANPQPNFILSFPIGTVNDQNRAQNQKLKLERTGKVGTVINNFRKKHVAAGICSPWSVHATCLPVNSELAWSVWLHGCSASMWLRVERGSTNYSRFVATSPLLNTDCDSLADWGVLSDNWSREGSYQFQSMFFQTKICIGKKLKINFNSCCRLENSASSNVDYSHGVYRI